MVSNDPRSSYAGPCGWCGDKCGNENVCEPVVWLKRNRNTNYEDCLKEEKVTTTIDCQERTKTRNCYAIRDRETCLITNDPRGSYAGPCGWCGDKCGNENVCEPVVWLKRNRNTNYEDCLKGQPGKNFNILTCKPLYQNNNDGLPK